MVLCFMCFSEFSNSIINDEINRIQYILIALLDLNEMCFSYIPDFENNRLKDLTCSLNNFLIIYNSDSLQALTRCVRFAIKMRMFRQIDRHMGSTPWCI